MFELDDGGRRLAAHVGDRVLVTEPVGTLDGVVEMEAPVVLAHVAEGRADSALRGHRVAARREDLGDAGGIEPRFCKTHRCAQARATGADDNNVRAVLDESIGAHPTLPVASL